MVKKTITVINEQGLHMRPAGVLAKAASVFKDCNITLNVNGKSVNAKAVMQIMSAAIKCGAQVEIVCEGTDEQAALDGVAEMFENGFGE